VLRSRVHVLVLLAGCKDPQQQGKTAAPPPAGPITVKDASGATVAELMPIRPCRASVGPQELIVGGPPLVAMLGSTKWTGSTEPNGTILLRDDQRIARVYPTPGSAGDAATAGVYDLEGVAKIRVKVTGRAATVEDAGSIPIRKLTSGTGQITADSPALTITGTDDLILAALLSAPELLPEVRMLAACERVLAKGPK
jgi:hypothetical protein